MIAAEFKTELKKVQELLRGKTLQLVTNTSVFPHHSLRSFGESVLELEKNNMSFHVTQVWTSNGIILIESFKHLAETLTNTIVTGIQVKSYYQPTDFSDFLKYSFGTTE